jgi:hypothetical protein
MLARRHSPLGPFGYLKEIFVGKIVVTLTIAYEVPPEEYNAWGDNITNIKEVAVREKEFLKSEEYLMDSLGDVNGEVNIISVEGTE